MLIQFFSNFDPITGTVPPSAPQELADIAQRARALIKHRTKSEIVYAANSISFMLDYGERYFIDQQPNTDGLTFFISPARSLRAAMPFFDIEQQDDFPHATWTDYFAILALWLVSNAVFLNSRYFEFLEVPKNEIGRSLLTAQYQIALDAMEAICIAESTHFFSIHVEPDKSAIELRNKKAAIISHEAGNAVKQRFIEFYYSNDYHNKSDAARRFIKTLTDSDKSALTRTKEPDTENMIRTLTTALRDHERSMQDKLPKK